MPKKAQILFAIVLILTIALSACGNNGQQAAPVPTASPDYVATLTAMAPAAAKMCDMSYAGFSYNQEAGTQKTWTTSGGTVFSVKLAEDCSVVKLQDPATAGQPTSTPFVAAPASCGDAQIIDTKFQGTVDKPLLRDGNFGDQWTWVVFRAIDVDNVAKPFWGFVEVKYYSDLMIARMAVTAYNVKATARDNALCMAYQMAETEMVVYFGNNTPKDMTNAAPTGWTTTVKPYPDMADIWAGNGNYTGFDILIGDDNHDFTCATTDFCYMQEWLPKHEGEAWHTLVWSGYRLESLSKLQGHGGIFSNPPLAEGADPIGNFMQDTARKVILDGITKLHAQFCGPVGKAPAGWSTTMDTDFTCVAP